MPQKEQENKVENKRLSTTWEFIKYIGFGILLFFLIVAVRFHAPWKMISVLLIFTLACIVLPKPYKKWFWMAAAIAVLTLLIWIFIPGNGKWIPYNLNLEKELNALNKKFALPENENAAVLYNQLMQKQRQNYHENRPPDPNVLYYKACKKPWKTEQFPEFSNWLKKQDEIITALIYASKKKKCFYKIGRKHLLDYPRSMQIHTKCHKNWYYLISSAANNDIAENRIDKALQKQTAMLAISEHLRQQPFALDLLTGLILETNTLNNINKYLVNGNPDKLYLDKLDNTLRKINHNWKNAWAKILPLETIKQKNLLLWTLYEKNKNKKIRRTRERYLTVALGINLPKKSYRSKILAKAESVFIGFFVPANPDSTGKIVDDTLSQYSQMTNLYHQTNYRENRFFDKTVFNLSYLIHLTAHKLIQQQYDIFIQTKSFKKATEIIIELRRYKNKHGHWPQKLENIKHLLPQISLSDPLNNSDYGYKLNDENFILYSKGKNKIDDNAKGHFYSSHGPDDRLIWPGKK